MGRRQGRDFVYVSEHVERLRDELLILKYRSGHVAALDELVSRWQPRILAYLRTVLGDEDAAWDVSQEVWISAISALGRWKPPADFAAWIHRVAHNKTVSHLRKHLRRRELEGDLPEPVQCEGHEAYESVSGLENANLIRECLLKLPFAQREALTLFYLDALSVDEIAGVLGIPPGTVRSRLHYARSKMKNLLLKGGYCDEA